jgi:hypothetical protein
MPAGTNGDLSESVGNSLKQSNVPTTLVSLENLFTADFDFPIGSSISGRLYPPHAIDMALTGAIVEHLRELQWTGAFWKSFRTEILNGIISVHLTKYSSSGSSLLNAGRATARENMLSDESWQFETPESTEIPIDAGTAACDMYRGRHRTSGQENTTYLCFFKENNVYAAITLSYPDSEGSVDPAVDIIGSLQRRMRNMER